MLSIREWHTFILITISLIFSGFFSNYLKPIRYNVDRKYAADDSKDMVNLILFLELNAT